MEADDNARSCARATNHQGIGRRAKGMLSGGIGNSKRAIARDGGEISETREGNKSFKAKEQKLGQHLGKDTLAMKENQAHPTGGQRKSLENPAETIEKEEVHPIQSPKSKDATSTSQLSPI